jgi:hypothetical protein
MAKKDIKNYEKCLNTNKICNKIGINIYMANTEKIGKSLYQIILDSSGDYETETINPKTLEKCYGNRIFHRFRGQQFTGF